MHHGEHSDWFDVTQGLWQGCVLYHRYCLTVKRIIRYCVTRRTIMLYLVKDEAIVRYLILLSDASSSNREAGAVGVRAKGCTGHVVRR